MLKLKHSENSHRAIKYKIISLLLSAVFLLPFVASAAGLIPCDGTPASPCDFKEFATMIDNFITRFLELSTIVAAITFSIAGAKMLMNPENSGERDAAKKMFRNTVIGLVIILTAWLVVHTIVSTFVDKSINAERFLQVVK